MEQPTSDELTVGDLLGRISDDADDPVRDCQIARRYAEARRREIDKRLAAVSGRLRTCGPPDLMQLLSAVIPWSTQRAVSPTTR